MAGGAVLFSVEIAAAAGKNLPPLIIPQTCEALTDLNDNWARAVKEMAEFLRQRPSTGMSCGECFDNAAPGGIKKNYIQQVENGQGQFKGLVKQYRDALGTFLAVCAFKPGGRGAGGGGWVRPDNPVTATKDQYCH
jgi:hypothetical protein